MEEPQNTKLIGRNPDGTFKPGFTANPGGRPKNTLKNYVAVKLSNLTDEEKEKWLKEHNIPGLDQWKMAEGNPEQKTEMEGNINYNLINYGQLNNPLSVPASPVSDQPAQGTAEIQNSGVPQESGQIQNGA